MPEIARFFGSIIRMFAEPVAPQSRPHFHAYDQKAVAVFAFDTISDASQKPGWRFTAPICGKNVTFADGLTRTIDFLPVLRGELYGPLREPGFFKIGRTS